MGGEKRRKFNTEGNTIEKYMTKLNKKTLDNLPNELG